MKWGLYAVVALVALFLWGKFASAGKQLEEDRARLEMRVNEGEEPDEVIKELRGKIDSPNGWTGLLERYREAAGA